MYFHQSFVQIFRLDTSTGRAVYFYLFADIYRGTVLKIWLFPEKFWQSQTFPELFRIFSGTFPEFPQNISKIFLEWMKKFWTKSISPIFSALCACLVSLPIFQSAHLLIIRLSGITFRIKNNGLIEDILSNDSSKCYVKKETWISQIANKESHKSSAVATFKKNSEKKSRFPTSFWLTNTFK